MYPLFLFSMNHRKLVHLRGRVPPATHLYLLHLATFIAKLVLCFTEEVQGKKSSLGRLPPLRHLGRATGDGDSIILASSGTHSGYFDLTLVPYMSSLFFILTAASYHNTYVLVHANPLISSIQIASSGFSAVLLAV